MRELLYFLQLCYLFRSVKKSHICDFIFFIELLRNTCFRNVHFAFVGAKIAITLQCAKFFSLKNVNDTIIDYYVYINCIMY